MASENFTPPAPPIGVIESLTAGFETVVNRLYLIMIPLALDVLLWLGPRVSYQQALGMIGSPESAAQLGESFQRALFPLALEQQFHPMSARQFLPALGMPSVLNSRDAGNLPFALTPPALTITSLSGMMLLFIGSFQAGLILLIPYLGLIAQAVNDGRTHWKTLFRQSFLIVGQVMAVEGVLALPIMICFIVATPLTVAAQAGAESGGAWALIPIAVLASLWLAVAVLLSFTVHSMFLNNRNILSSMWDSMRVVQWNMPATLGLLILTGVIFMGMQFVWRLADTGSWLTLAAIGGNAFVSTGLAAATFVFFKDRYRYWSEFREQLIAELERRRIIQDRQNNNDKKS